MAAPPPKPQKPKPQKPNEPPADLAEVERALSILQGRHPETERLRREDEEKRARRQAEQAAVAHAEARRLRSRRLVVGGTVSAVVIVTLTLSLLFSSELARRARLERAADPYRAMGFVVVESSSRSEPSKLEASVPAGCLLATAATSARVGIARTGGSIEGPGPVLTCLCEGAHVTVTSDAKAGEGLVLLRADASSIGGSRAFAFLPFKTGTTDRADQACAEASLDAWLDAKRWEADDHKGARPATPADTPSSDAWLSKERARASLRDVGFKVAAVVKPDAPFGVIEVPASSCVLLAPEHRAERTSLRLRGGVLAIGPAAGNVAWCTSAEALVLAQRGGETSLTSGEIAVIIAPAARVGGLAGLREIAEHAGLVLSAASVAPADHAWSAKQLLLASAIPEHLVSLANTPDLGADAEARIVALSMDKPGGAAVETPADVFSFCEPALSATTTSVCVFSGAQKWSVAGPDAVAGIARTKLPFWLFALQGVSEPEALKLETELITLARRLRRDGFEPTTIEAVTELDKGAEVLGRANEDAMVVVGLAPSAPWIFPYTDGPAWALDGEPRVVPIKPLERVTVTSTAKKLPPKATRRTVVFRRHRR